MATNNFLTFCPTDSGTNLLTQGEYAIAADRTVGNQPGVASSKLVNKAIRQSSVITSQLAQYLSDKMATNILDDGNLAPVLALMNSGFAPLDTYNIENLTLATAVGSSALTISVKTQSGGNPSATDIVYVGMRSATLTSGLFNRRSISAALSVVVSSGSTLGQADNQPSFIWVYLIDNAGTLELAVSGSKFSEAGVVSTTAEGGAGAADSRTVMYSTTSRSNVPFRLIGYILNTQTTAGTWASAGTQIQLLPSQGKNSVTVQRFTSGSGTYVTPAGCTRIRVRMVGGGGGGSGTGTGAGTGGTGGTSTFGSSLLTCVGGGGGVYNGSSSNGGAPTVNSPAVAIVSLNGGRGNAGVQGVAAAAAGSGANSSFGGGGGASVNSNGLAAESNTGSGGAGAGATSGLQIGGGGGSAGAYIEAVINNPLASYAYAVGAAGTSGTAGTSGSLGGAGGSGVVIVEEFYD